MFDQPARETRQQCMVSRVLLFISVLTVASLPLAWADVYKCLDAEGQPLLTNKPARLHDCHVLSEGTYPEMKPSEASS